MAAHPRLVVLRTFSKAHGLAALRVGYGIGTPDTIATLREFETPFAVGSLAAAVVPVALAHHEQLAARVTHICTERDRLATLLGTVGARPLDSEANFLFVPGSEGVSIGSVLSACGVAVKHCRPHGVRISVGDRAATDHVIGALRTVAAIA